MYPVINMGRLFLKFKGSDRSILLNWASPVANSIGGTGRFERRGIRATRVI